MNKITLILPETLLGDEEKNIDFEVDTVPCVNDVVFFDNTDFIVRRRVYLVDRGLWGLYLEVEA